MKRKKQNNNDDLDELKLKLYRGAYHDLPTNKEGVVELGENPLETILKTGGATLTREECRTLWRILTGRRRNFLPRGRKPVDDQDQAIAWLVAFYEASDGQVRGRVKRAAGKVEERYGVTRSRVRAAMKKYPKYRQTAQSFDPARLQDLITAYESRDLKTWKKIP